jgi:uncharacterized protein (TIGR04255 family)
VPVAAAMSPTYPPLRRPPIVEGLIDFQFDQLPPSMLLTLELLQDVLPEYPVKRPQLAIAQSIQWSAEGGTTSQSTADPIGFQFWSADNSRVVTARLNGLTVSSLAPYAGFDSLRNEAQRLWSLFCKHLTRPMVRRVALRYLNRLELPLPLADFFDFLKTAPTVAADLPQGLAQFSMRLVIPDVDSQSVGIVTEFWDGAMDMSRQRLPVILDIDVFRMIATEASDEDLWTVVSELRGYKNRLFFGSITDRMRAEVE